MKKLFTLALALLVAFSVLFTLASCMGNNSDGDDDKDDDSSTAESSGGSGNGTGTGSSNSSNSNGSNGGSINKPSADESLIDSDIDMARLALERDGFTVEFITAEQIDIPGAISGLNASKETTTTYEVYTIIYFSTDAEASAYYNNSKDDIAAMPEGTQTGVKGTAVWVYMANSGLGNVDPEPDEGGSSTTEGLISTDADATIAALEAAGFDVKEMSTEQLSAPGIISAFYATKITENSFEAYSLAFFADASSAEAFYDSMKEMEDDHSQVGINATVVWMFNFEYDSEDEPDNGSDGTDGDNGNDGETDESLIIPDINATKKALEEAGFYLEEMDVEDIPGYNAVAVYTAMRVTDTTAEMYTIIFFSDDNSAARFYNEQLLTMAAMMDGIANIDGTVAWVYVVEDASDDDDNTGISLPVGEPIAKDRWIIMLETTNFEACSKLNNFTISFDDNTLFIPQEFMGMEMYITKIDDVTCTIAYVDGMGYIGAPVEDGMFDGMFNGASCNIGSFVLGNMFTADSFNDLTFDSKKGCYLAYIGEFTFEFYFVNGIISVINIIEDGDSDPLYFTNIGTTVVEIPEFTFIGGESDSKPDFPRDPNARTEITQEEWEDTLEMTNVTIDMGGSRYDLAENGYMVTSNIGSVLLIFEDGTLYTYTIDTDGNCKLDDERYIGKYYMDAGTILFNGEVDSYTYYDLVYDAEEGCYTYGDHTFYFENGVLVYLNDGITFYNHGEVVISVPGENNGSALPTKGEKVTKEEWAAMLELDNFIAESGEKGTPQYVKISCNGNVCNMTDGGSNDMYFFHKNNSTWTVMKMDTFGYIGMDSGARTPLNVGNIILSGCFTADSHDYIDFNEEKGCYTGQFSIENYLTRYDIYFIDGKLSHIAVTSETGNDMVYVFTNIGGVSIITVPNYSTF